MLVTTKAHIQPIVTHNYSYTPIVTCLEVHVHVIPEQFMYHNMLIITYKDFGNKIVESMRIGYVYVLVNKLM